MNQNPSHTEKELLIGVAAGNEEAFSRLVNLYRNKVFSHALTFVKSYEEAEEITQDIFVKVWANRHRLPEVKDFKNYLFILGRNHLVSAIRKKVMDTISNNDEEDIPGTLLLPDTQVEYKETYRHLINGLDRLPPQQKAVFTLSRMENLSHAEIGERLGISKRTVKFHLVQALNFLREYLRYPGLLLIVWLF
ncbi:RNA polymerase sigma factor [Niastella sp. OAS944]|uniref:RNA polymerase sigma factor n=1 Tax=Niastella sp. OAS944 TaxID=2664089 RepID=UPI00348E9C78|nr:RNA polymerase sigma-70 factor (ECF subfamily) [Chitinophagaceae bacterium OAS944]